MYVQTQTLAEMAPSKDSIDPEDPTTTWVTTKSILLSETFPMEFTTGGTSSREIVKVKYLTLFLVRYFFFVYFIFLGLKVRRGKNPALTSSNA